MSDTANPHQLQDEIDAHNQAYLASQIAQHARLKKLLPFIRPIDDLDANIRQIVETMLSIEPKLGKDLFTLEDISEMMDSTVSWKRYFYTRSSEERRSRFEC